MKPNTDASVKKVTSDCFCIYGPRKTQHHVHSSIASFEAQQQEALSMYSDNCLEYYLIKTAVDLKDIR